MRRTSALALLPLAFVAACSDSNRPAGAGVLQSVVFETRTEVPVGAGGAVEAVLADLDGDRDLDLAVACHSGTVQVLLGANNGTFQATQSLPLGDRPFRIRAADLDGDGDQDLAVLRLDAHSVTVLRNDGRAAFTVLTTLASPTGADALEFADCDGDGKVDVSVGGAGEVVSLFRGDGAGAFSPSVPLALAPGAQSSGIVAGDATADGVIDLLVCDRESDKLYVFPGLAGGGHGAPLVFGTGDYPVAAAVGDVNRDGTPDIVVANFGGRSLTVLRRIGAAYTSETVVVDGDPVTVRLADLNGDGHNDITLGLLDRASVSLFTGLADGSLAPEVQLGASGTPFQTLVGDVNGDGRPDLIATSGNLDRLSLFAGKGGGVFASRNFQTGIPTPEFVAAGDFDGDGRAEMAVAGRGSHLVSILRAVPDPATQETTLELVAQVNLGRAAYNVVRGDFDRDGRPDLAVSCEGGVKLLGNVSQGDSIVFQVVPPLPSQVIAPGVGPFEVAVADLNGDGADDLVVADAAANQLTVVRAVVPGFRYELFPQPVLLPGVPAGVAILDFDGNGVPDVAVSRNAEARITILKNDGQGNLSVTLDVPVGAGPNYLRAADFNADGRTDLVTSNAGVDAITVLMAVPGGFTPLTFQAGARPTALLTQDLNRDGHADILVASLVGADFRVLLGDGKGGFPVQLPFPGTYRATSAALADVRGVGLPDLLVASVLTTRLSHYPNVSK
ncbi:MAG: VCBS repeat-containing protein [Planctomycetes bacterium]|nr:VCBS repeat-containing protein [Planctomycetota bacterium]